MDIQDISEEQHLRQWLAEQVLAWNRNNPDKVGHTWIEPGFGSSIGVSDAAITFKGIEYGIELKHLITTSKGVCYKIRPVQRRYNVMGVRNGRRLLVLATVASKNGNELVMIRGDKVPLRDYIFMEGSGCEAGVDQTIILAKDKFAYMMAAISNNAFWPNANYYSEGQKGLKVTQKEQQSQLLQSFRDPLS